jgi:hypothetical protein
VEGHARGVCKPFGKQGKYIVATGIPDFKTVSVSRREFGEFVGVRGEVGRPNDEFENLKMRKFENG